MKKITLGIVAALFAASTMNAQQTVWEDSFENYDDFAIENIGGWTQIDNDGLPTYGSSTYSFTNSGYVGTGIIFNASQTEPSSTESVWQTRTGNKGLYFMSGIPDTETGTDTNDDYFITPQIDLSGATGSEISFWAKSLTDQYGLEKFELLLSTSGTEESDFTVDLSGVVSVPADDYTQYSYDLSEYDGQQIYIALHYISSDIFVLQTDDFKVTAQTLSINDNHLLNFNYSFNSNNILYLNAQAPMDKLEIFNLLGQKIISKKLSYSKESILLDTLNSGIYLAQVEIKGQTKTFKFFKK